MVPLEGSAARGLRVLRAAKVRRRITAAVAGLEDDARLEAVLRFIVEFQNTYSLRRIVDIEPEHVVYQMTRVMPIMRDRLLPHFPGPNGRVVATVITRVALSHALIPDDDSELFYAELRHAAGLDPTTRSTLVAGTGMRTDNPGESSMNPKRHRRLTQGFLAANSLFWLPWGLINLIKPQSWSGEVIPGMDVYDLSSPVARTEVRAMYGGLQMAIGTAALVGAP